MEPDNFTDFTEKYICNICNTKCSRKSEWERHLLTRKHQKHINGNNYKKIFTTAQLYHCQCGNIYKNHSGLWKHKKKCPTMEIPAVDINSPQNELNTLTNLVLELVKSNTDLQKQMMEVCKHNTQTNNIIHSIAIIKLLTCNSS